MSIIIIYHWLDWYKGKFTGNHRSIHWIYLSCRFSLKPIHWIIINHDQPLWFTMASPRTDNPNDFRTPHGWSPRSFSPRGPRRVEHLATGPAPNGKISGKIGENLWGWASQKKVTPTLRENLWCDTRKPRMATVFRCFFPANWAPKYNVLSGLIEKWWEMHCQLFSPFIAS
jgi:hypothetical protein